jgi:hypothetical protein
LEEIRQEAKEERVREEVVERLRSEDGRRWWSEVAWRTGA